jgi:molecular chaperone GrpE
LGEDPVDDPVATAAAEATTEERLAEVLSAYRQLRAEQDGYRARVTRDVERQFDRRRERLLLKFIEVLDNLDRALEAAERSYAGNPLIEGLILVRTQLLQILQQEGLERVPVLGLPYDPAVSEAVGTQPVGDRERDHLVVSELLRGYRLLGRVVRASHVVIGAYQESAAEPVRDSSDLIGADEVRERAAAQAVDADGGAAEPLRPKLFDQADIDEMLGDTPAGRKD